MRPTPRETPKGLDEVKAVVRTELRRYLVRGRCNSGTAVIPVYSDEDPDLYVLADFGSCGKGILVMEFVPTIGWRPSKLVMETGDVAWFSGRIANRSLAAVEF